MWALVASVLFHLSKMLIVSCPRWTLWPAMCVTICMVETWTELENSAQVEAWTLVRWQHFPTSHWHQQHSYCRKTLVDLWCVHTRTSTPLLVSSAVVKGETGWDSSFCFLIWFLFVTDAAVTLVSTLMLADMSTGLWTWSTCWRMRWRNSDEPAQQHTVSLLFKTYQETIKPVKMLPRTTHKSFQHFELSFISFTWQQRRLIKIQVFMISWSSSAWLWSQTSVNQLVIIIGEYIGPT